MNRIALALYILSFQFNLMSQSTSNHELIYVGDPMCSWCYGISEEITQVWDSPLPVKKSIVLGGLRPGGGDEWNSEFTNFLRHHWEEVADASGVAFSYQLLDKEHFNYDTEPACRAVVIARDLDSEQALSFFKYTQHHFYFKNNDPKEVEFYKPICEQLDIDFAAFRTKFNDPNYKQKTASEFSKARSLGVNSFPTILLKKPDGQLVTIARGYARADDILQTIQKHLAN